MCPVHKKGDLSDQDQEQQSPLHFLWHSHIKNMIAARKLNFGGAKWFKAPPGWPACNMISKLCNNQCKIRLPQAHQKNNMIQWLQLLVAQILMSFITPWLEQWSIQWSLLDTNFPVLTSLQYPSSRTICCWVGVHAPLMTLTAEEQGNITSVPHVPKEQANMTSVSPVQLAANWEWAETPHPTLSHQCELKSCSIITSMTDMFSSQRPLLPTLGGQWVHKRKCHFFKLPLGQFWLAQFTQITLNMILWSLVEKRTLYYHQPPKWFFSHWQLD